MTNTDYGKVVDPKEVLQGHEYMRNPFTPYINPEFGFVSYVSNETVLLLSDNKTYRFSIDEFREFYKHYSWCEGCKRLFNPADSF